MNGRKVTLGEINKIKLLRSQGYSIIEIGNKLKRPKTTIFRYVQGVKILPKFFKNWAGKRGGSITCNFVHDCGGITRVGERQDFGLQNRQPGIKGCIGKKRHFA